MKDYKIVKSINSKILDTGESIWFLCKMGFIKESLEPIICLSCGEREFTENTIDTMDNGFVCEYEVVCEKCGSIEGYWAHGNYIA